MDALLYTKAWDMKPTVFPYYVIFCTKSITVNVTFLMAITHKFLFFAKPLWHFVSLFILSLLFSIIGWILALRKGTRAQDDDTPFEVPDVLSDYDYVALGICFYFRWTRHNKCHQQTNFHPI